MLSRSRRFDAVAVAMFCACVSVFASGARAQDGNTDLPPAMQHLYETPVDAFTWGAYRLSEFFRGDRVFDTTLGRLDLEQRVTVLYSRESQQIRVLFHLTDGYINQYPLRAEDRVDICERVIGSMRSFSGVSNDGSLNDQGLYAEFFSSSNLTQSPEAVDVDQWIMQNTFVSVYLPHILANEDGEHQQFTNYMCCADLVGTPDDIAYVDLGPRPESILSCP